MSPPLWFANFLAYCLQVILLVVVGTALPALFRLRAPRVLLAYWQGLLVICLVLPALQPWRPPAVAASVAVGTVSISFQGVPADGADLPTALYPLIVAVLLAGMLARLGWLALGLGRLRAIRRAARAFDPLPHGVRELESRLGVSPAWYLSPGMESPATFGLRPPSILLPERFPRLHEDFQRAIAGHELLHVVRRDWILNLVEELILTVFWFHPAVAWVVNRIRLSREQTVDAEVVRLISARKPYLNALLVIAGASPGPALGAAPTFLKERQLVYRIELLVKEVTMSKPRLFLSLTAMVGLLTLAGVVGVWAFPLRAPAPAAAGSQSAEKQTPPSAPDVIPPVKQVMPVYPPAAKKAGIQGIVRLRVTINKDGSVNDIRVLSGPPPLVKAAMDAVQQWRYALSQEVRVTIVPVNFTLAETGAASPAQPASKEAPPLAKTAPKVITKVNPVYPPEAKKAGIQGIVVLRATIEKDGSVSNLLALSGPPQLVKAALEAVQKWRYEPGEKALTTDVTINFTLAKDGGNAPRSGVSGGVVSGVTGGVPGGVRGGVRGGVIEGVSGGVIGGVPGGVSGGVYTVGDGVSAPIPIYKPEPGYTKEAKDAKLEGHVVLSVIIGADGAVTDVNVVQPSDKGLTENAVETVKTWKFKPAMKAGKPVPCKVSIEVSFRMF
jgi:TonB family protein